jgi:hypothetical protein
MPALQRSASLPELHGAPSWRLEAARKEVADLQASLYAPRRGVQQRDGALKQLEAERAKTAELRAQQVHMETINGELQDAWVGVLAKSEEDLQVGCPTDAQQLTLQCLE